EKAHPFAEPRRVAHSVIVLAALRDWEVSMRTITTLLSTPLILMLGLSTPVLAHERHAVSPSVLAAVVAAHTATVDADRATIRAALDKAEVRSVAQQTGIDIERVTASLDTLDSSTIARAAESARQVNEALTGGASTITISTTTIIIVLLLIILI